MINYTVIDKKTNKEVSTLDVLLNDGRISKSYYKFKNGDEDDEEDDDWDDDEDWDGVFSLSPNGTLYIEGVSTLGGDYARITHFVDKDRYEAVLVNNN